MKKRRLTRASLLGFALLVGCAKEEPLSAPADVPPAPESRMKNRGGKKAPTPTTGQLAQP